MLLPATPPLLLLATLPLAAGAGFQDRAVAVWSLSPGSAPRTLGHHSALVTREGWVAFTPDGRFRMGGDIAGAFWHVVGLCRFEPGELDPYLDRPLRIPEGEPPALIARRCREPLV